MINVEQGDLLKLAGMSFPVIVVSNNLFNESGKVIICPIRKHSVPGPLHIELEGSPVDGYVLCEQVKYIDLNNRRYTKLSDTHYYDVMNISDAVMSIFDYQRF